MFFPESLLELSARDRQVSWLDPQLTFVSSAGLLATLQAQFIVPLARALLLQHAHSLADPGAAQIVNVHNIRCVSPTGATVPMVLKSIPAALAADANSVLDWQGAIVLPAQWIVEGIAIFNAAVASNTVTLSLAGMLIPIGNIQR